MRRSWGAGEAGERPHGGGSGASGGGTSADLGCHRCVSCFAALCTSQLWTPSGSLSSHGVRGRRRLSSEPEAPSVSCVHCKDTNFRYEHVPPQYRRAPEERLRPACKIFLVRSGLFPAVSRSRGAHPPPPRTPQLPALPPPRAVLAQRPTENEHTKFQISNKSRAHMSLNPITHEC